MLDAIYALGFLSGIQLLFIGITGRSAHRSHTIDPKQNPEGFRKDVVGSAIMLAIALGTALVRWIAGW